MKGKQDANERKYGAGPYAFISSAMSFVSTTPLLPSETARNERQRGYGANRTFPSAPRNGRGSRPELKTLENGYCTSGNATAGRSSPALHTCSRRTLFGKIALGKDSCDLLVTQRRSQNIQTQRRLTSLFFGRKTNRLLVNRIVAEGHGQLRHIFHVLFQLHTSYIAVKAVTQRWKIKHQFAYK